MVLVSGYFVSATSPIGKWNGFKWNVNESNGVFVSGFGQRIITIAGQGMGNYWNNERRISKTLGKRSVQVDLALADLPASASSAGIWLVKDSQNALIVEKHRDITDPQYHTNVFIVERVNGMDNFMYVSPDLPSANFDTYKIQKTQNGYNIFYNGPLVYTGNLNLSQFNTVALVGVARATGDQINATFRRYSE